MKNPECKKQGYTDDAFDIGNQFPTIQFGPVTIDRCKSVISANGQSIFWVNKPETEGAKFRINACLLDEEGKELLTISDNHWEIGIDVWDVEVKGRNILIRKKYGAIALQLRLDPPKLLVVERVNMNVLGYALQGNEREFKVLLPNGREFIAWNASVEDCDIALDINTGGLGIGKGGGTVRYGSAGSS